MGVGDRYLEELQQNRCTGQQGIGTTNYSLDWSEFILRECLEPEVKKNE